MTQDITVAKFRDVAGGLQEQQVPGPRRVPADVTLDDALARVGGLQLDEGRTATEGEVGLDVVAAVRGLCTVCST